LRFRKADKRLKDAFYLLVNPHQCGGPSKGQQPQD